VAHSLVYERRRRAAIEALWENVSAFRATLGTVPPEVRRLAIEAFQAEAARLLGPNSPLLRAMVHALRHDFPTRSKPTRTSA
jgi:hypothetical protein